MLTNTFKKITGACSRRCANGIFGAILKTANIILIFLVFFVGLNTLNLTSNAVTALTNEYSPRPAKDGRKAILHGDFSKDGTDKSIIVIPSDQKGNSKTVEIGSNGHSSVGGWDSIEMDCFNRERGYYKTTLRLKKDVNYQFKIEQKNSAGIKDVWYGLDGYMSRFDTDTYNGGSDANINLYLKHDDDVTFFFIDGDRGSFEEWQPQPPHSSSNQPGTKFHLITVSTKIRNNLQGIDGGIGSNNIFDNNASGAWRWRSDFSPVWYSLTSLPQSGEINKTGADILAKGELYMFRRTDVGELGIYGKWQLDNDIENPAQDKNSDYWKNAGEFFSNPENAPKLNIIDSNGKNISFVLPYASDEKQPRHEEGANNIIFEGTSNIESCGVYTYYFDEINLDGTLTDDAQNFVSYQRHPAQSIYLPSLALTPVNQDEVKNTVALSGQIHGQNKLTPEKNEVYILIVSDNGESADELLLIGFEKVDEKYQKVYNTHTDADGLWDIDISLPNGSYSSKIFADVFTPQLIDPLSRNFSHDVYLIENTEGINDSNNENSYYGQSYLKDFITKQNTEPHYAAFAKTVPLPTNRIYEVNNDGNPVAIGSSFEDGNTTLKSGTHTRTLVLDTSFIVNNPNNHAFDAPKTGHKDNSYLWLIIGFAGLISVVLKLIVRNIKIRGIL